MSDDRISRGTKRTWAQWLEFLDAEGARELPHKEIAQRIVATGDSSPWWAQTITVEYERHIGRRAVGQDHKGSWNVSASRTLEGTPDELLARWRAHVAGREEFNDLPVAGEPSITRTENRRVWRVPLLDASRVAVSFDQRGRAPPKAAITVTHERLHGAEAVEPWRAIWKSLLAELG